MAFALSCCASVLWFTKRRRLPNKSSQMCLDFTGPSVWIQQAGKDFGFCGFSTASKAIPVFPAAYLVLNRS